MKIKQHLLFISALVILSACNTKLSSNENLTSTDTTGINSYLKEVEKKENTHSILDVNTSQIKSDINQAYSTIVEVSNNSKKDIIAFTIKIGYDTCQFYVTKKTRIKAFQSFQTKIELPNKCFSRKVSVIPTNIIYSDGTFLNSAMEIFISDSDNPIHKKGK